MMRDCFSIWNHSPFSFNSNFLCISFSISLARRRIPISNDFNNFYVGQHKTTNKSHLDHSYYGSGVHINETIKKHESLGNFYNLRYINKHNYIIFYK